MKGIKRFAKSSIAIQVLLLLFIFNYMRTLWIHYPCLKKVYICIQVSVKVPFEYHCQSGSNLVLHPPSPSPGVIYHQFGNPFS